MRLHILNARGQLLDKSANLPPQKFREAGDKSGVDHNDPVEGGILRVTTQCEILKRVILIGAAYKGNRRKTKEVARLMDEVVALCHTYWYTTPEVCRNFDARSGSDDGFIQIMSDRIICGWQSRRPAKRSKIDHEIEIVADQGKLHRLYAKVIDLIRMERISVAGRMSIMVQMTALSLTEIIHNHLPPELTKKRDVLSAADTEKLHHMVVEEIDQTLEMADNFLRRLLCEYWGIAVIDESDMQGGYWINVSNGVIDFPLDDPLHESLRQSIRGLFANQKADQVARGHVLRSLILSEVLVRTVVDHFPDGAPEDDLRAFLSEIFTAFIESLRLDAVEQTQTVFRRPGTGTLH